MTENNENKDINNDVLNESNVSDSAEKHIPSVKETKSSFNL